MRVKLLVSPQQRRIFLKVLINVEDHGVIKKAYLKHSILTQWKIKISKCIEERIAKLQTSNICLRKKSYFFAK